MLVLEEDVSGNISLFFPGGSELEAETWDFWQINVFQGPVCVGGGGGGGRYKCARVDCRLSPLGVKDPLFV